MAINERGCRAGRLAGSPMIALVAAQSDPEYIKPAGFVALRLKPTGLQPLAELLRRVDIDRARTVYVSN
jgi:hypothetical protein